MITSAFSPIRFSSEWGIYMGFVHDSANETDTPGRGLILPHSNASEYAHTDIRFCCDDSSIGMLLHSC